MDMEEDQIVTEVEDKGGKSVSHNPPKYDRGYDFHVAILPSLKTVAVPIAAGGWDKE